MKGYQVSEFGEIDVLKFIDLPEPVAGPDQVIVRVHASGVNYAETAMRAGVGPFRWMPLPFGLGQEAAGVIESVGANVTAFKPGDRVFGRARGAHAELALFDSFNLMRLPDNLTFAQAAAIPVGFLTAWHALVTVADLQPGQRVLLEAIASSVSSAALQIAKSKQCWVAGTTSNDAKIAVAKAHGADAVYNYQTGNVAEEIMRDTDKHGADVALVIIGTPSAKSTIAAMANEGKVLLCGAAGGFDYGFDLTVVNRNLQFLCLSIMTSSRFVPETMKTFQQIALPLFANETFKSELHTTLPFAELGKAHQVIADRQHYGKIVLQWQ